MKEKSAAKAKTTRKRKPTSQAFAFVDTTIFLDFYRTHKEANLSLLEKLKPVKDRIISTYQVEDEFLRNRQRVLLNATRDLLPQMPSNIPAVVSTKTDQGTIKRLRERIEKQKIQMDKRVSAILRNPRSKDRVWKVLREIFESPAEHVLTRDMKECEQIKEQAWERFIRGNPPRKDKDNTIGDALNWEWIIHCAKRLKGQIIIVSGDGDYGPKIRGECFLNDQLQEEFRRRVKGRKSITLTNKLSEALLALKVPVSKEEKEAEDSTLQARPSYTFGLGGLESIQAMSSMHQLQAAAENAARLIGMTSGDAIRNLLLSYDSAQLAQQLANIRGDLWDAQRWTGMTGRSTPHDPKKSESEEKTGIQGNDRDAGEGEEDGE